MPSQEALTRYRAAMNKYKKACSNFQRARYAFEALEAPSEVDKALYYIVKGKFKEECKEYSKERDIWNREFLSESKNTLGTSLSNLVDISSAIGASARTLIEEEKKEAIKNSPAFRIIAEAAKKHIQEKEQESTTISSEKIDDMDIPFEN
jgi:hypothetical protein